MTERVQKHRANIHGFGTASSSRSSQNFETAAKLESHLHFCVLEKSCNQRTILEESNDLKTDRFTVSHTFVQLQKNDPDNWI